MRGKRGLENCERQQHRRRRREELSNFASKTISNKRIRQSCPTIDHLPFATYWSTAVSVDCWSILGLEENEE
jgi:hypothetical protein